MGKRAELELEAIRLYAEGKEIPTISELISVSQNSLREWKKRAGNEWDEARQVTRTSVVANTEDARSRVRRSREIAAQIMGDSRSQSDMGLALNQALQSGIYDLIGQIQTIDIDDEDAVSRAIERVNMLTLSLGRLETAAFRNTKNEQEIRKKALEDAAKEVEKTAKQEGVSAESIMKIRRDVLMMAV
jgi:hypothetical protein